MNRTRLAAATGAVLCAAGLAFAPSASAADPIPPCPADVLAPGGECLVQVTTTDGVHARVRLQTVLCVKVDALSSRTTANARVRIPCPPGKTPVVVEPVPAPPVTPDVPAAPEAPAPDPVQAHLPVTG